MTRQSLKAQLLGLVGWLVATFAAGGVGAIASARAAEFYGELSLPSWAPPASLFGPVWSVLYLFMAVAAWLVWRERGFKGAAIALWLFVVQLIANALWTWLFFVLQNGALATTEILVLWLLVAATIARFWPIHRLAALLLVPYLAWVGFASALTLSAWRLNPAVLG
jgi:benzodiazapine receptor